MRTAGTRGFIALTLFLVSNVVLAQDDSDSQPKAESAAENALDADMQNPLKSLVQAYVEAYNAGDANELATYWSDDGVFEDQSTGEEISGRSAIQASLQETFAKHPGLKLDCITSAFESVSPNVSVETGEAVVTRQDGTVSRSNYRVVYVQREGKWLIDRVTDHVDSPEPDSTFNESAERLAELEWLVGQWVDRGDDFIIELNCSWTRGKRFLSQRFSVTSDGEAVTTGLQLIGWDAHTKEIRSWLFDDNGTVVQGEWSRQEDGWRVQSIAVFADGTRGSFTTILTPIDSDRYRVEKINRQAAGQILPNMEAVVVVRQ